MPMPVNPDQALAVDLLVVVDDRRLGGIGRDPGRIVGGCVPAHVERCRVDTLCGQGQGHRHLVDVDRPLLQQFGSIEEPAGPVGPRRRHPGQQGTRDQIEATVVVARLRSNRRDPTEAGRSGRVEAGSDEDVANHLERGDRCVHQFAGHGSGWQVELARVLEHRDIGVAENGHPIIGSSASRRAPEILLQWGERASKRSTLRTVTPWDFRNPRISEDVDPTAWTTRSLGLTPARAVRAAYQRNASRWKRGCSSTTQANRPSAAPEGSVVARRSFSAALLGQVGQRLWVRLRHRLMALGVRGTLATVTTGSAEPGEIVVDFTTAGPSPAR